MSGNQKAIEELEALYRDLLGMTEVGMLRTIAARITALKAEPEPDPSDTKELLMETQTSSSDSPASEPAIPPSVDTGAGVDAGPISSGGGASAGLLEAAWKVCEPWMNGGPVMPSIQSLADAIKAEKQRDTGTVYELAELRAERDRLRKERDYLVSEYERAIKINKPQGYNHAAAHIYNAIVNAKCDANASRFLELLERAEKAEAALAKVREAGQ